MDAEKKALISTRQQTVDDILADLRKAQRALEDAKGAEIGKLPNIRGGFYHNHIASYECGIAYWEREEDYDYPNKGSWKPCKKLVNHNGQCGYENHTAF